MSEKADSAGDDAATEHRPATAPRSPSAPRFTPGTMLGERYRIVALLGSGGMGEVYRADDTRLGQQVALKFLPRGLQADPQRLERLYSEVRLGRQVSHPNVCRIYDVAEWEGNHFLAMEYVDGEDLASLLRRIGKLPTQKAFDIARDICAGLAAAHALGIVHRDLKPANIMIDGRGAARITDFGLAAVAEDLEDHREIAGTPAYMAPEQLTRGVVTQKTDLYALGLVLYEIFTGRRLFESTDSAARRSATKTLTGSASSGELEPVVQRVIARCVEENPDARPASIHSVIAALPGGDPLQAAVDAGETPSPQMVAAASEVGDLNTATAWTLLGGGVLLLGVMLSLFNSTALISIVPTPKPPDVLLDRAKMIVETAGADSHARGTAHSFGIDDGLMAAIRENREEDLWSTLPDLRPGPIVFQYRQSPESLIRRNYNQPVSDDDPPFTVPGMVNIELDSMGRLLTFAEVPPRMVPQQQATPVDWSRFFEYAGGDFVDVQPVSPLFTAPIDTDRKYAWSAAFRENPKTQIRVEAGSSGGKPVWFQVIRPWMYPRPRRGWGGLLSSTLRQISNSFLVPLAVITAVFVARRNVLRGRGDRRTAARLALFALVAGVVSLVFTASTFGDPRSTILGPEAAHQVMRAVEVWVLYLAIEPYMRRIWPQILIGWSRLFAGRFRDPMVGRDVLIGVTGGSAVMALRLVSREAPAWFGQPKLPPYNARVMTELTSARYLVADAAEFAASAPFTTLFIIMMFLIGYAIFRRRWPAIALIGAILVVGAGQPQHGSPYEIAAGVIMSAIFVFILARFGMLAMGVLVFTHNFMTVVPFTLHQDAWYFAQSAVVIALLITASIWGFRVSLGEKKPFAVAALEGA